VKVGVIIFLSDWWWSGIDLPLARVAEPSALDLAGIGEMQKPKIKMQKYREKSKKFCC
jgi:hypothetical protein